ncbi:(Fe-S)-binding protein [Halobacillus locisalis]|uniref:Glycolate oxidase iron-sulfur subunit n=1 Tax=Halobacillus locisalis TaxID=220753 RepID=A0A838CTP9_9BACI|nr:(Fe-S)-binding protein [Halobacillus locisalis]MBA2175447.1 (Fe-S)-binding protein [Halobacillus locisalis]
MSSLLKQRLAYDATFDCVQCGYCLPACPTYETMESETHSPRGRINLVKMVAEGKAEIDDLREPIEKCLGCMACTTVCPTNVQYGKILESAQDVIEDSTEKRRSGRFVEDFLFNAFFPSTKWMDVLGNATWLFQKSGLDQRINDWDWLPLHLNEFASALPSIPSPKERKSRATRYVRTRPATAKVGFFKGCVMDSVFFESNQNTIELLLRSGAEVVLPESQTCCGALHGHAGKAEKAVELAKENIRAFEAEAFDYIVNNAGGCGAKLIEYPHLFEEGSAWKERAIAFSDHVVDISQVLVEMDRLTFTRPLEETVTYQPSCHMQHVQKVIEPPLAMLEKVPGLQLEELERPDFCCGSAGIYNIVNYEESMKILDVKMGDVSRTNAGSVVTCNPGCLLQMKLGIKREGMEDRMDAVHLVDLLMRAEPRMK